MWTLGNTAYYGDFQQYLDNTGVSWRVPQNQVCFSTIPRRLYNRKYITANMPIDEVFAPFAFEYLQGEEVAFLEFIARGGKAIIACELINTLCNTFDMFEFGIVDPDGNILHEVSTTPTIDFFNKFGYFIPKQSNVRVLGTLQYNSQTYNVIVEVTYGLGSFIALGDLGFLRNGYFTLAHGIFVEDMLKRLEPIPPSTLPPTSIPPTPIHPSTLPTSIPTSVPTVPPTSTCGYIPAQAICVDGRLFIFEDVVLVSLDGPHIVLVQHNTTGHVPVVTIYGCMVSTNITIEFNTEPDVGYTKIHFLTVNNTLCDEDFKVDVDIPFDKNDCRHISQSQENNGGELSVVFSVSDVCNSASFPMALVISVPIVLTIVVFTVIVLVVFVKPIRDRVFPFASWSAVRPRGKVIPEPPKP